MHVPLAPTDEIQVISLTYVIRSHYALAVFLLRIERGIIILIELIELGGQSRRPISHIAKHSK